MKVNNENPPIQLNTYQNRVQSTHKQQDRKSGNAVQGLGNDTVQLSAKAKEVQEAAQKLAKMPEIREDKVQEVKTAIEKGTYKVVGRKVATDMLKETFENNVLLNQIDLHA